MTEESKIVLAMAARLTSYPTDEFYKELEEIREWTKNELQIVSAKENLLKALDELSSLSLREVREQYVASFDLKERTGLYLTAHELGDSRERGMALIEMMRFIRSYGFEPISGEMPDYLPMLYELAAAAPWDEELGGLLDRLSYATQRIRIHLEEPNPYKPIFDVLMENVLKIPTEEKMREMEQKRQKPDHDPMPYPLMYK